MAHVKKNHGSQTAVSRVHQFSDAATQGMTSEIVQPLTSHGSIDGWIHHGPPKTHGNFKGFDSPPKNQGYLPYITSKHVGTWGAHGISTYQSLVSVGGQGKHVFVDKTLQEKRIFFFGQLACYKDTFVSTQLGNA